MLERRRHYRVDVFFPVQIDSTHKSDRIGIARNSSHSGLLIGTPSHFQVGDELELTYAPAFGQPYQKVKGHVVRINLDEEADLFRQLVAVELESRSAA
jgi:hypothetical protein